MKKYVVFSVSFILVFTILQVVSGMFLTLTYTPDIAGTRNVGAILSQETFIVGSHNPVLPIIIAFLSASIAYFIPNKLTRTTNTVK